MENLFRKYTKEASVPQHEAISPEEHTSFLVEMDTAEMLEHYEKKTKKDMEELMKFMKG